MAALWCFGPKAGAAAVQHASAGNLKPVWTPGGGRLDWLSPVQGQGAEYLRHATQVKTIWVPYGE